jgi:hypothetical protein
MTLSALLAQQDVPLSAFQTNLVFLLGGGELD